MNGDEASTPKPHAARTPTQRMLQVLWLLNRAPGGTLQSHELWRAIREYQDGASSGRRLYRMDLASLKARGLVLSGQTTRGIANREAVVLRALDKPRNLHLSAREHAALRAARDSFEDLTPVPVTTGPGTRGGAALDTLTAAVRVLEEHGDDMLLSDLAAEVGRDSPTVLAALQQASLLHVGDDEEFVLADLHILCDDEDEEAPWAEEETCLDPAAADPKRVSVVVLRGVDTRRPLVNAGLAALGRFAYTMDETQERLALIDRALAARLPAMDEYALRDAKDKLERWAHHLRDERL